MTAVYVGMALGEEQGDRILSALAPAGPSPRYRTRNAPSPARNGHDPAITVGADARHGACGYLALPITTADVRASFAGLCPLLEPGNVGSTAASEPQCSF